MPTFDYVAVNRFGKKVKDSVEAASLETAKSSLRATGLTILEIKPQNVMNKDIDLPFLGKPSSKDMAVFCRQFVSILRAGVSVSVVGTNNRSMVNGSSPICSFILLTQSCGHNSENPAVIRLVKGKCLERALKIIGCQHVITDTVCKNQSQCKNNCQNFAPAG